MRKLKTVIGILGTIALLFVVSILMFYIHTAVIVGYLPIYGNPDPKDVAIHSFYMPLVYFTLVLWLLSFFVWLLVSSVYMYRLKDGVQIKPLFISFVAHVLAWTIFSSEILNWFLD
ncbi:hypothetical protein [Maribacter sp. 2210JD10-5]|uniref:hypothetical protein n=1 Tax=Maribacter sp. 2210JD10-5 TaxID=3386272 RepID=UPI0039BD3A7C